MKLDASYNQDVEGAKDDFSQLGVGIVHFGVGAFHRAHQAVYTHKAMAKHGGDWCILGVSLQTTQTVDALNDQGCLYSLVTRGAKGTEFQIIRSIKQCEAATRGTATIFQHLASPNVRIVSMTVTEKAYGILRAEGGVDITHESIVHDLANPDNPRGVIGIITKGLRLRKTKGLKPFTVMCCDNLPQNGDLVQGGVIDFAKRIGDRELAIWVEEEGAFPNSMVDRITPATTTVLIEDVSQHLGVHDAVPIETEPFSQWVVEDNFVDGRPSWNDVGVLFVDDVVSYERMKLRILNGAHSLIAYSGFLKGHKYVRDAMADERIAEHVHLYMQAAAKTLAPLDDISFETYAAELIERFKNPNIAHETYQIAMDGSQKMPQRIFEPALDSLRTGLPLEPFAFATAAWIFYCRGEHTSGETYALRDPREEELLSAFNSGNNDVNKVCDAFFSLRDLFPKELAENAHWHESVSHNLRLILEDV